MEKKTRFIGNFWGFGASFDGAVWNKESCCPTLRAAQSHGSVPYVICKGKRVKSPRLEQKMKPRIYVKRTIVIGQMDNTVDHTFESANRVYGNAGCCPTIPTCGGGGIQPKVIKVVW